MNDDWEKQLNVELKRSIEIGGNQGVVEELEQIIKNYKQYVLVEDAPNYMFKILKKRLEKLKRRVGVEK